MKTKELKNLTTPDLVTREKSLKKDLFDLNYQRRLATVEKPARFKNIKREIARILTIIKEREISDDRSK